MLCLICAGCQDSAALRYVNEALRGDREFVLDAIQRNAEARALNKCTQELCH